MIEPAVTGWPANTLTPSRFAAESRPFFDEPRPFLCAILSSPARDRDLRQLGAVTAHLLVAALGLVLEDAELRAPEVADALRRDGALELRPVDDDVVAARHQHLGRERLTGLERLPVDEQALSLLDP